MSDDVGINGGSSPFAANPHHHHCYYYCYCQVGSLLAYPYMRTYESMCAICVFDFTLLFVFVFQTYFTMTRLALVSVIRIASCLRGVIGKVAIVSFHYRMCLLSCHLNDLGCSQTDTLPVTKSLRVPSDHE
jgi:hypothetical protein